MTDKKSLVDIVAEKIQSNPYIQFCLADGLINYSALARHYLPEIEKSEGRPVNEESVMVAIKRYSEKVNFTPAKLNYAEIFSQVSVGMHEDMAFGVCEKTDKVIEEMTMLFREEKWEVGEIRTVMEEPLTITALVKKSKLDRLCEKIEGKLIKDYRDFSMVTMKFAKSGDRIYGTTAIIADEMAKRGIAIIVVSTPLDIYILVEDEKSQEAYGAIKEIIKSSQKIIQEK